MVNTEQSFAAQALHSELAQFSALSLICPLHEACSLLSFPWSSSSLDSLINLSIPLVTYLPTPPFFGLSQFGGFCYFPQGSMTEGLYPLYR